MASSYIPTKDPAFDTWFLNWATLLVANPALYGAAAADATQQQTNYNTWHTSFLVITNPATKTKPAVAAKNAARVAGIAGIRPLAQTIAANKGVSNANKLALGLNLHGSTGPTPIPPPSSFPNLSLVGVTPGVITFKFVDSADGISRKKPAGTIAGALFAFASATPITNVDQLSFVDIFTAQPFGLDTSGMDSSKTLYYAAYWQTRTGEKGPWSPIQSTKFL